MKITKDKILVVDDDQMMRLTLGEALRIWGNVPVEAGTVAEAISVFDAEP